MRDGRAGQGTGRDSIDNRVSHFEVKIFNFYGMITHAVLGVGVKLAILPIRLATIFSEVLYNL